MPLTNKRMVVTRAPHQARKLVDLLREKGAVPLTYPVIDIAPPENLNPLDAALRNWHAYEWLLITSSNTPLALKRRFQALQIEPDFAHIKVASVGEATAESIESVLGVAPQLIPEMQSAAGLADALNVRKGMRVFLPQSAIAGADLADSLREKGADVTVVDAYCTIMGQGGEDVPTMIAENRVDALTFTSSSTVKFFIERIQPQTATHLPAACIGQPTADTARELGFQTVLVAGEPGLESMVQTLEEFFAQA